LLQLHHGTIAHIVPTKEVVAVVASLALVLVLSIK